MKQAIALFVVSAAAASAFAAAHDEKTAAGEQVSLAITGAFEPGAAVLGKLRMPDSERARLPAVLIVNSSPGFDGRGAFYAEALAKAGIASFEVDMFQGKGLPATPRHNMPHAFQALRYLADHPRIDETRIGIMGFSWGGAIALLTSSEELAHQYGAGKHGFAAHLGMYPICWRQRTVLAGTNEHLAPAIYRRVTGRPVHVAVGEQDGYDTADDCRKFVAELPAEVRVHFSLTVYADATFAWDSRFGSAVYEMSADGGKGGIVKVVADPEIANRSREFAVAYFRRNLSAE